jgi:hypothetical protein
MGPYLDAVGYIPFDGFKINTMVGEDYVEITKKYTYNPT